MLFLGVEVLRYNSKLIYLMKTHIKAFAVLASGVASTLLVSCDKEETAEISDPVKAEQAAIPADKPEMVKPIEAPVGSPTVASPTVADPLDVSAWKAKAPEANEMDEIKMMKQVVTAGVEDPQAAVEFLVNSPQSPRRLAALRAVASEWYKQDKEAVIQKADSLEDEQLRSVMRLAVVHNTPLEQMSGTKKWVTSWAESDREKAIALQVIAQRENPETPHICGPECGEHAE